MRILIVEDDQRLAQQLKKGLEEQGQIVSLAFDGMEGLEAAHHSQFDVVVLDVMLPGLDGFSIVRRLRTLKSPTPILLLTARDAADDVVAGLDAGADDYLTKPFSFKVLQARIRALGRRGSVEPSAELKVSDLALDPVTHEVTRAGAMVSLTRTEFVLLETLMRNAGRVLTRARIIDAVWGYDRDIEDNTLDVFIRQLRAKIDIAQHNKLIHTVRGVGYVLREEGTT
jgi:DNA-binding response OmpR family regulator